MPPRCDVAQVVDGEHAQADAHLRADRIQVRIEGLLGDREIRDAHRRHAIAAPDEDHQRRFRRQDLERAAARVRIDRQQFGGASD